MKPGLFFRPKNAAGIKVPAAIKSPGKQRGI